MPTLRNERGQGLVEYILIVVVMGILAITVIQKLSTTTQRGYSRAATDLDKAIGD